VLEEIGHRAPCFAYGEPAENPEWLGNVSQDLQLFWQKRRQVSVTTQQYFSWLYQAVWDCDVTMSGSYQTDPDDRGVRQITTFSSLTKVGAVQTGRENKMPQYNSDGTTTLVPDPSFNSDPSLYGQIPESWLMKQRHNPCVQSNSAAVYFDVRYRSTGQLIKTTGLNDPPITSWAGAPANASQISITSLVSDQTRYFYAAYTVTFPFSRTLGVQPAAGSTLYATHYDPDQNKIWPMLLFGGSPATVNWEGLAPRDAAQPSTHPTTTALGVDGVTIPAGTSWNLGGTSGNLNISTKWLVSGKRDL
jgi:hypothetical protein